VSQLGIEQQHRVQRWAVEAGDPGVKCMTKDDCYRRRMEGMRMHYGPTIPYTDDGFAMIQEVLQQTLANVMGLPLRYLQATHVDTVDVMDTLRTDLEDALAHAFFKTQMPIL